MFYLLPTNNDIINYRCPGIRRRRRSTYFNSLVTSSKIDCLRSPLYIRISKRMLQNSIHENLSIIYTTATTHNHTFVVKVLVAAPDGISTLSVALAVDSATIAIIEPTEGSYSHPLSDKFRRGSKLLSEKSSTIVVGVTPPPLLLVVP